MSLKTFPANDPFRKDNNFLTLCQIKRMGDGSDLGCRALTTRRALPSKKERGKDASFATPDDVNHRCCARVQCKWKPFTLFGHRKHGTMERS